MVTMVVVPPGRGTPKVDATFALQQDRWDDFGFKTQYHLFYQGSDTDIPEGFIGSLKILKRGQIPGFDSLLAVGPIARLGPDFCSIGQSLDFYERLAALPSSLREETLHFLRDILFDDRFAEGFDSESGWRTSLLRDVEIDTYKPLARTLLERDYSTLPSIDIKLSFQVKGWQTPLSLSFAASRGSVWSFGASPAARLPERIAVITGRNGSGKSTLLARLARVLHASQAARRFSELVQLGTIEPPGIGFTRIITIAYSAFDTFQMPGVDDREKRQIAIDVREGSGRYIFAGLRDIARELEERLEEEGDTVASAAGIDRQRRTYLKSAEQLAEEFSRMVMRIEREDRTRLLYRVIRGLLADPSFSDIPDQSPDALFDGNIADIFMSWSTGHKIVMHAIVTLVAYTERKTMVLLDEPESHLHPPLLAALMHAVRTILDTYDAFAVVATHSPVVAQETLGRHVSVVSRVGDIVQIEPPRIETYGESIGEITDELFGLHPGATDYHSVLRAMVDDKLSLEQISSRFDKGLSMQARAYVMSLIAARPGDA